MENLVTILTAVFVVLVSCFGGAVLVLVYKYLRSLSFAQFMRGLYITSGVAFLSSALIIIFNNL